MVTASERGETESPEILKLLRTDDGKVQVLGLLFSKYQSFLVEHARRNFVARSDAEDLVQDFFQRILSRDVLVHYRPERGRLRSFLLVVFKNFVRDYMRRWIAKKRGGGEHLLSFAQIGNMPAEIQDGWVASEPKYYSQDRAFAFDLLISSLGRFLNEVAGTCDQRLLDFFFDQLAGKVLSYTKLSEVTGLKEKKLRNQVQQLRARLRKIFFEESSAFLSSSKSESTHAELRSLADCLCHKDGVSISLTQPSISDTGGQHRFSVQCLNVKSVHFKRSSGRLAVYHRAFGI
jgi:RNA polymerase sigma factor (sigma-70 family)